jgi:hypothetical protein
LGAQVEFKEWKKRALTLESTRRIEFEEVLRLEYV